MRNRMVVMMNGQRLLSECGMSRIWGPVKFLEAETMQGKGLRGVVDRVR